MWHSLDQCQVQFSRFPFRFICPKVGLHFSKVTNDLYKFFNLRNSACECFQGFEGNLQFLAVQGSSVKSPHQQVNVFNIESFKSLISRHPISPRKISLLIGLDGSIKPEHRKQFRSAFNFFCLLNRKMKLLNSVALMIALI